MRRRRALLARLLVVAMLASLFVMVGGTTASADPIPPTTWPSVTIGSDLPGASDVMTDANGGVTVGCQQTNTSTLFESFDKNGTKVQDQSKPVGYSSSFCPGDAGNSTVGKDGTVYVAMTSYSGYNPSGQYIQAWKNNSLVWTYTIPCGPYGFPWAMTMGADDNLYVVISQGGGSCYGWQLIGLTPTAQSGTSPAASQEVMNHRIYAGSVYGQGLAAYNDGLVMYTSGGIQYAPYTGTWPDAVPVSGVQGSYIGSSSRWFEATVDGKVFLPIVANSTQVSNCFGQSGLTGGILAITPDNSPSNPPSPTTLYGCTKMHEMHPTPTGGVAMRYAYSDSTTGWNDVERISANGWVRDVGSPNLMTRATMAVDLNGDVALHNNATPIYSVNGSNYIFPEIDFMLLSGATGELITSVAFSLRGEHDTLDGPSYMWGGGGDITLAKNTVYVTAYPCHFWNSGCDMSQTRLYAFTVPGADMDYPRGAILGAGETPQNYIPMGDSFSAGQGVPPFTDGSGCNRSTRAYPELLAQSAARPLVMQSFIACSGATTQDVRLGGVTGPNQPKQVDALSTSTKIVTITIGGNDIGFGPLAEKCVEDWDCTTSTEYSDALYKLVNVLPGALDQAYGDIKAKLSSTARVLVVGYPMMIPDPAINTLPNCPYLSHNEKVAAQSVINQLNQAIQDAASRAGAQFEYVDPNTAQSPFKGHELCMDGGYYNGVDLANPDYSLHPNANGQDAYRRVIETYLG